MIIIRTYHATTGTKENQSSISEAYGEASVKRSSDIQLPVSALQSTATLQFLEVS